ncbi:metallophosphoesterase family protein [Methylobacterium gnaphalii]|uniref:Phosphatase n=1 Tax=Methylobacterium gnaphalii TaxID=1010610 RepID=A0A512JR76_9HYPH|nr:metallophosphoesterase [Methylobacterium gnaphalii]GEP12456.1 phosphatase [Methylobacterium gnaphalii]GJD70871.1 3',5'-cyclic adenosine monophosphate phosphodiesterase CpdA [Methylobacterium gnaphalii]GLS51548.1 phosphatase [Methylobacterium gnaphalii]
MMASVPASPRPSSALRIQVVSDLHVDVVETGRFSLAPGADLVVVAGDTCAGAVEALTYLRHRIPAAVPLVAVLGNHEFYGRLLVDEIARARAAAEQLGVTLLENDVAVIGGVRFLGATLWTDYALHGCRHRQVVMAAALRGMNDHHCIAAAHDPTWRGFLPTDAAALHAASRAFIARTLATPFPGPSVVVTHHGPHPSCIAPRYGRDPLSASFASDLTELIVSARPDLWISGHTHHPVDERIGATRLVSNPHGYGNECAGEFDPALVIELACNNPEDRA